MKRKVIGENSKRYRKKDIMIWVIGGTKDSRDFLEKFVNGNLCKIYNTIM